MMMTSVVDIQIQELNHSAVLPDAGDVVTIMSTIGHSNISGVLPDNMTFFINDLSPYLLPSTNNAVIKITNSSGTINTFTLTVTQLLTSGYQINETLNFDEEFLMEFNLTVSELVYPQMNMTLNLTISYSGELHSSIHTNKYCIVSLSKVVVLLLLYLKCCILLSLQHQYHHLCWFYLILHLSILLKMILLFKK